MPESLRSEVSIKAMKLFCIWAFEEYNGTDLESRQTGYRVLPIKEVCSGGLL